MTCTVVMKEGAAPQLGLGIKKGSNFWSAFGLVRCPLPVARRRRVSSKAELLRITAFLFQIGEAGFDLVFLCRWHHASPTGRAFSTRFVAGRTKPNWVPRATPALQGTVMGIARGITDQDNRRAAMVVQRRLAPGFRGRGGEVHRGRTCWRTRDFHRCVPERQPWTRRSRCLAISRLPGRRPRRHPVRSTNCPQGKMTLCVSTVSVVCGPTGHRQG